MQLEEAQELVRLACRLFLIAGGGILIYLGIIKWKNPQRGKILRDAEILGFLTEYGGRTSLCCPVVNLGESGTLRPVAVLAPRQRWRQKPGETIPVEYRAGDFSCVTLAQQRGNQGFAAVQIFCGLAVVLTAGLITLGVG